MFFKISKAFQSEEKFDLIVSNPPYFEESDSEKDKLARQAVELNFLQLISKSSEYFLKMVFCLSLFLLKQAAILLELLTKINYF
ncbi:Eco57I restriction-modification methylase domain-containing protein [Chryseobacterium indoltheticum]|uniref:Eco57I restriction-modification methylase domain-containing protein n=1 Tax=Chryseobacterium indoltheticum TaxID=254 RepID=UPI003F498344